MRIAIVADDLTGAMDAAAPFADLGASAAVMLHRDDPFPASASVLSVDTDTREASAQEAANAVRDTMAKLCAAGTRLPFKKIDSTLRGNIGAETMAALAGSGRRYAIVTPAAPAQGRVLRHGELLLHGERLNQNLIDMLRSELPDVSVRSLAHDDSFAPANDGPCILVADAQDETDLDRIAQFGLARQEEALLVGSSGLAAAVARQQDVGALPRPVERQRQYRQVWFVVGSYNSRSAEQVRALLARGEVAKVVLPLTGPMPKLVEREVTARHRIGVIHVEGLDTPAALDPHRIAAQLGELAAMVLGRASGADAALVITGGDTAQATLARLGVRSVDVRTSLFPGVVHGTAPFAGQELGIVTKAGGFGDPDLFVRLASRLVGAVAG